MHSGENPDGLSEIHYIVEYHEAEILENSSLKFIEKTTPHLCLHVGDLCA
jgi:hypothetical protein